METEIKKLHMGLERAIHVAKIIKSQEKHGIESDPSQTPILQVPIHLVREIANIMLQVVELKGEKDIPHINDIIQYYFSEETIRDDERYAGFIIYVKIDRNKFSLQDMRSIRIWLPYDKTPQVAICFANTRRSIGNAYHFHIDILKSELFWKDIREWLEITPSYRDKRESKEDNQWGSWGDISAPKRRNKKTIIL